MDSITHTVYKANDRSYFALLKKDIHATGIAAGLGKKRLNEMDLVVSEMATNLIKHGGGGQLLTKIIEHQETSGIEIISIDNGPGMNDVSKMMADGMSTKHTLGLGLGAIKRLSDFFQVYTQKDWGTVMVVRIYASETPHFKKPDKVDVHSIVLPKPGEEQCGDGFFQVSNKEEVRLFLGDGLGHGKEAEAVVLQAGEAFQHCTEPVACDVIRHINNEVRKTRGLVGTVALLNLKEKKWSICGVGNIITKLSGPTYAKNYLAYNGIIGLNVPKTLNAQEVLHEKGQHLIMCSDGLKSRWDHLKYTNILRYDPTVLCATLIKDFARNTDDMSVVVAKING